MGNQPSSTSKPQTPTSPASGPTLSGGSTPHDAQSPRHSRRDTRSILHHTHHRSIVPPAASLAQAQGSTIVSRPKSLPGTAVSSLSGSPLSNNSTPTNRDLASAVSGRMEKALEKPAEPRPIRDEPTKPVDVPGDSSLSAHQPHAHYNSDTAATQSDANLLSNGSLSDTYLQHPPRLPLPIEEELHTPGSPILAPQDDLQDLPQPGDVGESSTDALTRKSSGVSAGTAEEDDTEELRVDKTRPVVPTKLEWNRGGERIYVTGSIFQWNRKQRLQPVEGKPGCFAATIHILPGTHHVRFLVDGIMQTSPDLPTTVDFGNNLVNYIEVSPEDAKRSKTATPVSKPGSADAETDQGVRASRTSSVHSKDEKLKQMPRFKSVPPADAYRNEIPQYLQDFDQAEDSPAYQNAVAAIEKLATPPSLPGFLGKPILNAAVLMKDDNSVLNMPNHTVLNHLATSSIKNGVLAVSATTRFRNKYVTTIIYKPTSVDDG